MIDTTDRLTPAIEAQRKALAAGVRMDDGEPITADLVAFEKGLDNSLMEVAAFQNLKSRAQLRGTISFAEAQVIYVALGGEAPSPNGWGSSTDLATKVVVTSVLGSLVGAR